MNRPSDRGSTLPLILGFFLLGLLVVAGAVVAGQAFVQQRDLQDVCDGAAAAAAAGALDLDRATTPGLGEFARFGTVQQAVDDYLAADPARGGVSGRAELSEDARTLTVHCAQTRQLAFGAMFGKGDGVHHTAVAAVRAPLS